MSFYEKNIDNNFTMYPNGLSTSKPTLVDNKVLRKIKKTKSKIEKNRYSNVIKKNCISFIKHNYGILIIFLALILILYYRYQDVKKRRQKNNK